MPVVKAIVNGKTLDCLVDTGSGQTLVDAWVVPGKSRTKARSFVTADGKTSTSGWSCRVSIGLLGHCFWVTAIAVDGLSNLGVDCLLGCDVIDHMGGVTACRGDDSRYTVRWGKPQKSTCCRINPTKVCVGLGAKVVEQSPTKSSFSIEISDKDFTAKFVDGYWLVNWRWTDSAPSCLQTRIGEYKSTQASHVRDKYNEEVRSWISKGWLVEWNGPCKGVIPLLAVVQPTKDKVRPVMDYRELNTFIECHTGDEAVAICAEKVRKWRQLPGRVKVVDLKSAYLQIHIAKDLWKFQVVRYQGKHYALTRLGFGLSSAPRIMSLVLTKVLSLDDDVRKGTDHYIDDIVVDESIVSAERVCAHLRKFGLEPKDPVGLPGGRLLGIALHKDRVGELQMQRGTSLADVASSLDFSTLTKRGVFSLCGKLVSHYPVVGWLRPHCSFLKRLCSDGEWDTPVSSDVRHLAEELLSRARSEDPVTGRWKVRPEGKVTVWSDASSIAIGVVLEVDGEVIEDASWLRKKNDHLHINVAELEAVGRGINLAIAWKFEELTVATDSRTVVSWLDNTVEAHERVRTKSAGEMLIKRRLQVIKQVISEYGLAVKVVFVPTVANKADKMTRVIQRWLNYRDSGEVATEAPVAAINTGRSCEEAIWAAHLPHHLGAHRTHFLSKMIKKDVRLEEVKRVLSGCEKCQSIDPAVRAENRVERGELSVEDNWTRVAVDVTHYSGSLYLSMVDCGPSRFAIWRRILNESAAHIVSHLRQIVIERGPFSELLLDNSATFRSATLEEFADEWGICLRFRAAYAPSGNGIVERNHRTIKRMAARGNISPEEATFWFNVTPRQEGSDKSVPSRCVFSYPWRVPYDVCVQSRSGIERSSSFAIGTDVWVKPPMPSCTEQWSRGRVTRIVSDHVVEVDGMPRHVRDLRKRVAARNVMDENGLDLDFEPGSGSVDHQQEDASSNSGQASDIAEAEAATQGSSVASSTEEEREVPRRSERERRPPRWHEGYVMSS
jgi:ribonuclease HI